ncbi:hypothetical protein EHS25_000767 [Saitozyma podzolica]|uniref:Enoyl reductase (ER) domain-containing protein n=1 Tax=Saitozyma podzolica TaxID=1890683 RepID=A0A427YX65_9TREE|nr:hypothetical protein EHS25_000767 [Saitozyma podzolica]
MSASIPDTMLAVAQEGQAKEFVQNSPAFTGSKHPEMRAAVLKVKVPELEENDVLVKVEYAAQNPTDWKHSANMSPPGAIIGCDFSGTVVKLGPNPKVNLRVGDKVAGCVHGGLFEDKGSYAQYLRAQSDLVFKVPEGLGMAEAATYGVAWVTACQALVSSQKKPWPVEKTSDGEWFLIYGASSSVGLFAVSLAKAMGYRVIAICSPHSYDLVKSYGADHTLNYHHGVSVGDEVKQISSGGVVLGLDTISEDDSFEIALSGFKEGATEAQLNVILPPSKEATEIRKDVKVVFTLMYTLFGKEFNMTPLAPQPSTIGVVPGDRDFGAEINKHTPELITKFGIRANPIKIRGTLHDVTDGWQDQRDGKVSGVKLVYKVE